MTNMRRGFTMIELIFVIVIIGILAAVAIPKLAETAKEAKIGTFKSFMGTLNRTAGPAMWASTVSDLTEKGSVTNVIDTDFMEQIDGVTLNLASCDANGTVSIATFAALDTGFEADLDVYCADGTLSSAPRFGWAAGDATNEPNATIPYDDL